MPNSAGITNTAAMARVSKNAASTGRLPSAGSRRRYSGHAAMHKMAAQASGKKNRCMTKAASAMTASEKAKLNRSRCMSSTQTPETERAAKKEKKRAQYG